MSIYNRINELIDVELQGLYGDFLVYVNRINKWYRIYEGKQEWEVASDLDYEPTQKITNLTKTIIDTRSRFMFGNEPFFDIRAVGDTTQEQADEKEELLHRILEENKFHSKLLKARKDCSIGGKVAIKLWANKDEGLRVIFSPAQEFIAIYDIDDIDKLQKVIFVYSLNIAQEKESQRIKLQTWEMTDEGMCYMNEKTCDGNGDIVSIEYEDHNTELSFVPVIIISNGGLTGETMGKSDVELLWDNQDTYNRLTSDDIDALRFQMFGQDVVTDATPDSIESIQIAPGALIDLQTENPIEGTQAKIERLESGFSYGDKFADTINRIKNDMYELMNVPNVGLEQLKGLMQSGKSMKALYWGLIAACEEDWTEWGPALKQMTEYIFEMIKIYNLYDAKDIAEPETTIEIHHTYPIPEDEADQRRLDMEEVVSGLRSKKSYMEKWGSYEDIDSELEQIYTEQQQEKDDFTQSVEREIFGLGE